MNCGSATNVIAMKGLFNNDPKLVITVLSDSKAHWCVNRLSFAYMFNIHTHNELMLGFNHNDLYRLNPSILGEFLHSDTYVYKKKHLYGYGQSKCVFDVEMLYWYNTNQRLTFDVNPVIKKYWSDFKDYKNVNDFIPIMKYLEYCRDAKDKLLTQITNFTVTDAFKRYQTIADNLVEIEKNGLFTP